MSEKRPLDDMEMLGCVVLGAVAICLLLGGFAAGTLYGRHSVKKPAQVSCK